MMKDEVLHAIECDCPKCTEKWKQMNFTEKTSISPNMSDWVDGKIYPDKSGYYRARFKSGKIRVAYFTLVTTPNKERKSYGRWGTTHPFKNYVPLFDPIEWKMNLNEV